MPDTASVILVGGGLSGLELAKNLDRDGVRDVLVLEAGPAEALSHINLANSAEKAVRLWARPEEDEYFWRPWTSGSAKHFSDAVGLRRRLGGRSLYWHGVVLPIERWALREPWWPADLVRELVDSWQGGKSLYDRVRADIDDWRAGAPGPEAALTGLELGGYSFAPTPQAVRAKAWANGGRWEAYSPLSYFLDDAATPRTGLSGVTIVSDVEVVDVRADRSGIRGVRVRAGDGRVHDVASKVVVLAAGAVQNAGLALRARYNSGSAGDVMVAGLVDHIEQGFIASLDPRSLPAELNVLAAGDSFYFAPLDDARSNLFVRFYRSSAGAVIVDAWTTGEQPPGERNNVSLRAHEGRPELVHVEVEFNGDDAKLVDAQRRHLQDLWREFSKFTRDGLREPVFPSYECPDRTLHDILPEIDLMTGNGEVLTWCAPLGATDHESSTLAIGRVLDENQQHVDVPGLFVTGPAVFPRSGAANPSLTSLAVSKRLAKLLPV